MILRIEQIQKELFSAEFRIFHSDEIVGNIFVQGKLGSMETKIKVQFFEKNYEMEYAGGIFKEKKLPDKSGKAYRTYEIRDMLRQIVGEVSQIDKKEGWLSTISFFELLFGKQKYCLYPIGFGSEGGKHPVYCENIQIAQVEKPGEIYNDLHNYKIFAVDQKAAEISVLFSAYMYINANFKPGEKASKSYVKYTSITTNKILKEKYHPDFVRKIQL